MPIYCEGLQYFAFAYTYVSSSCDSVYLFFILENQTVEGDSSSDSKKGTCMNNV